MSIQDIQSIAPLLVSIVAIFVAAHYSHRQRKSDDERLERERENASDAHTRSLALDVCRENQNRHAADADDSARRIYARIEGLEERFAEKIATLSRELGGVQGKLDAMAASLNGGLDARIARALRSALDERRP